MYNNTIVWHGSEDGAIMVLINVAVITLGSFGILLNGFSLHVLWKCMTTGQLGIKLVLFSDLLVCVAYVAFNIQNNIVNSLSNFLNSSYIVQLATINRFLVHVTLFVSNWWIIGLLLLRILTIFSPVNVKSWDKMLYHRLMYMFCWIAGIVNIVPMRFNERYTRPVIYVVPVVLISIEAGFIIYGIRRVQQPHASPITRASGGSYLEIPCSSSSSTHTKFRPTNVQVVKRQQPYNNIVFTILLLALNFLILDSLLFIDTLHSISRKKVEPLPTWFMLLINIFSLMKRILNFVILCAKCRHFRKIMNLKLNLICRHFKRARVTKTRKLSYPIQRDVFNEFSHCADCQRPVLFSMDNEFISNANLMERLMNNRPFPGSHTTNIFKIANESHAVVNSYYSAFEMSPHLVSQNISQNPNHPVLSTQY